MGIDFGDRRIGVAISDPMQMIATAFSVVEYDDVHVAKKEVQAICLERQVCKIVIGLPLNMNGSEGPAVEKVKTFAGLLVALVDIPIEFWDERLTTKSAHDVLMEAGARRDKRKRLVDKVAAQIILQGYLDAQDLTLGQDLN